jgi:hypothetical protein
MHLWSRLFGHHEREREQQKAAERVERIRAAVAEQVKATKDQLERIDVEKGWNGGLRQRG